jgi:hypothetical protein
MSKLAIIDEISCELCLRKHAAVLRNLGKAAIKDSLAMDAYQLKHVFDDIAGDLSQIADWLLDHPLTED